MARPSVPPHIAVIQLADEPVHEVSRVYGEVGFFYLVSLGGPRQQTRRLIPKTGLSVARSLWFRWGT
jgi:hypothetical protein